jgi:hypothetical protein
LIEEDLVEGRLGCRGGEVDTGLIAQLGSKLKVFAGVVVGAEIGAPPGEGGYGRIVIQRGGFTDGGHSCAFGEGDAEGLLLRLFRLCCGHAVQTQQDTKGKDKLLHFLSVFRLVDAVSLFDSVNRGSDPAAQVCGVWDVFPWAGCTPIIIGTR